MQSQSKVVLTSYIIGKDSENIVNVLHKLEMQKNNQRQMIKSDLRDNIKADVTLDLSQDIRQRSSSFDIPCTVKNWFINKAKKTFRFKTLEKRIPIFSYMPKYTWETALSDFLAGITVGLTIIPQAIAYSGVAGLPAQIGLYSSIVAPLVYAVFGSSKDSPVGPTAIEGLLVKENNHELGVPGAVLLCFLSGCIELTMGVLNLGFLIDFISGPVAVAFTSAAAIVIATTQIKDLLGLSQPGDKFVEVWRQLYEHIGETSLSDCIMGLTCIISLIILKKLKKIRFTKKENEERTSLQKFLYCAFWLLSTSRNLLVVLVSSSIAYMFESKGMSPFKLIGFVKPGLPSVSPPPFSTIVDTKIYTFSDMTSTFGSGIIIIPILSILQNYAIAKVYSEGRSIDSTQEMFALGLCNIASSFVNSMPVSGALSRGAVNHASGVQTTFGGVYTAIVVILSLSFLTPWFYYIPKSALAAVIIVAVACMIELHILAPIWRTKKLDLIPAIAAFFACLFTRLEIGIGVGVLINLVFLLYATARPTIDIKKATSKSGHDYLIVTPDRSLAFPSVEYVRNIITKATNKKDYSQLPVVIDAKHIQGADYTTAKGMKLLMKDFASRNQPLFFTNLKKSVMTTFKGVHPKSLVHCQTYDELSESLGHHCVKSTLTDVDLKNEKNVTKL